MNFVELFCGFGIVTSSFRDAGFQTWKTDIRKRKGICEPDLRKNILQLKRSEIPFKKIHVLWASPPCDVWSYASGNFHWNSDGSPKTEKCKEHIDILKKTLELIEEISPDIFLIENPRGRLRNFPFFVKWLKKNYAVEKTLTYSSYGFPATKPTNIFTNARDISFKQLDRFGRGAKRYFKLDNISVCQKQKVPGALSKTIVRYCVDEKVEINCNICSTLIIIDKRALHLCLNCLYEKCNNCGHIRGMHVGSVGSCIHEFALWHKTKRGEFCSCECFIKIPENKLRGSFP
jgi:hypothetical protein